MAETDTGVAGMVLSYQLPQADDVLVSRLDLPAFMQPLIELEAQVPESYYINMLAIYPAYRNSGIGTALIGHVDTLAHDANCKLVSVLVFEENADALRLYLRLGFQTVAHRGLIEHECCLRQGQILLLTRDVSEA